MLRYYSATGGIRLAYFHTGEGSPLVVVPAWTMHPDRDRYEPASRPFWDALSSHRRVISYALHPLMEDQYEVTLESRVADLAALVEHLGLPRFDLLGMRDAAAVCIAYAAEHPERVDHLALVDAYPSGELVAPPEIADAICSMMLVNWRLGSRVMGMAAHPQGPPEAQIAVTRQLRARHTPRTAVAYFRFMTGVNISAMLPAVQAPTLVVNHASNRNFPAAGGEVVANSIPNARFVLIRGGDEPYYADYDAYFDILNSFLGPRDQDPEADLPLTHRQVEVLQLIAAGRTNAQIADYLTVSPSTVNRHVSNILARLGATNRTEAALHAIRHGLSR
jgi:DNA-binding NarL/FixJ family response regulator